MAEDEKMGEHIIEKEMKSELMLYDSIRDEVHVLNPTAMLVYRLKKKGKALEEIEAAVRRAFKTEAVPLRSPSLATKSAPENWRACSLQSRAYIPPRMTGTSG